MLSYRRSKTPNGAEMQAETDGYKINYNVAGDGKKTVVVLQGWGTTMAVYDVVVKALSAKYKVVTLDLPGFGSSTEPKEGWSVDDFVDFFLKFMKELGISSAVLIGHSYGGRMIIKLAARHQKEFEIQKIVLLDSAGIVRPKSFKTKLKIRRYKILKFFADLGISRFFFGDLIDEWKKKQGSEDYRNSSPIMRQCLVKAVNEDLTPLLSKIGEETLLIWGENDTATPLSDGKLMEEKIPNSGLAVIPGAGHYSFLDNPGLFTGIINAFL